MKHLKNIIGILVLGSMLLTQLVSPVAVYADGDTTPPPTDTTEVTTTPDPAETTIPILETSTPVPPDALEVTSTPVPTEPTADPVETAIPSLLADPTQIIDADDSVGEDSTLLETLQELPGDANIVVLDNNGDPLSLVTQEAADVIANSDPMWCPAGDTTITAACITANTVADLITKLGSKNEDGTVYFTSTYSANDVTFDGANTDLDQLADNTLTLQGGWDGVTISESTITFSGNSAFSTPITVTNWQNNVTVNNVTVQDVVITYATGLTVSTKKGNVNLNNITANHNPWSGLSINAQGDVTLNNITADDNWYGSGLTVSSQGNVYMKTITANRNGHFAAPGVWVWAQGNVTLMDITANNNSLEGLEVNAWGSISGDGITANENGTATQSGETVLAASGIRLTSLGNITLNNATATGNAIDGLLISTTDNATIIGSKFEANNSYGVNAFDVCGWLSLNKTDFTGNTIAEYRNPSGTQYTYYDLNAGKYVTVPCVGGVIINGVIVRGAIVEVSEDQLEFALDCSTQLQYDVLLPNGDQVQIFCPVSGKARISRLDNTTLPANLPAGYTYASAFSLDVLQKDASILVITEGGHIKASFMASALQTNNYSILYWDPETSDWILLKDFMLDENGNPQIFDLNPGSEDDTRKILNGVNLILKDGAPRVEVTTNFPGIFVLAQH